MKELIEQIIAEWVVVHDNMLLEGNKAAQRRARVATLKLEKLLKQYRKETTNGKK